MAEKLKADAIFLSPPWGGPSYKRKSLFDLKTMIPLDGIEIFKKARNISQNVIYYVPKSTDDAQLGQIGDLTMSVLNIVPIQVEKQQKIHPVAKTAFYGNLPFNRSNYMSQLVLHNLSFLARNERWLDEEFFAKNRPRKICEKNYGKKHQKSAENDVKMALFKK